MHDWTKIYVMQRDSSPRSVLIGKSMFPQRAASDLARTHGSLTVVWFARGHSIALDVVREAFASCRHPNVPNVFHPRDPLKNFVRHCKAENIFDLSPSLLFEVLPAFATNPDRIGKFAMAYRGYWAQFEPDALAKEARCG